MTSRQFRLHVKSSVGRPLIEDNAITYGSEMTLKFEPGKILTADTGISVSDCVRSGKVMVVPADKYTNRLKFSATKYGVSSNEIKVTIENISREFIRIERSEMLYKFQFVPNPPRSIQAARSRTTEFIQELKTPVVPETTAEEETVVAEAPVEETVVAEAPVEETVVAEAPVEEETPAEETLEEETTAEEETVVAEETLEEETTAEEETVVAEAPLEETVVADALANVVIEEEVAPVKKTTARKTKATTTKAPRRARKSKKVSL